ncbi:HAEPLYID family protein [Cytophaga hutchinsonii]|uniref:MetA-pathway of phenol degradation n=1 Tax=Cytophaga hutchinsonii (strain ATCC 33406 / DSM 1761 / CIP 103989 / NBRC 15051 / NCIMB 9469 / D465) TaxID=269798 RepID=A0A6N4SW05_CYTH3|nr:HAEPLYID family protein [Cytophaga hutchinsonii]ABG60765.1 conserved hypothetical protein [Cytophaga hutchinsonii ATCC 33406]
MKQLLSFIICIISMYSVLAQNPVLPKVSHAEPLYMDLIRDLGARRGEQELNVGGSIQKNNQYISYGSFIEYEFALFNRFDMEVEVPLAFYQVLPFENTNPALNPKNRMEGIKVSAQYTFLVSPEKKLSMAVAYTNQFLFHSFKTLSNENKLAKGNLYSPFLITAKKWGANMHTMLIAGPLYEQMFSSTANSLGYQVHASMFYAFLKKNFAGAELNHVYLNDSYSTILHPQIKYNVSSSIAVGLVTAIPINQAYEPSVFFRFIYEPKRK